MSNAQLSERERTCVYFSRDTGRILGFGPESMTPMYKEGWRREVLYHAIAIERYADLYRAQEEEDRQEADFLKSEREAPARKAIRDALLERNKHVDGWNKRQNDAQIALMDQRAERARNRKEQSFLLCEKSEGEVRPEDLALESPAFKEG